MSENHEHGHGHGHEHGHGHGHGHAPGEGATPAESADLSSDDVVECPVMPGVMVVKAEAEAAGLFRDYEGKRYWFCCAACEPLWDADPARYASA
jgi:YHS domain-containing protein